MIKKIRFFLPIILLSLIVGCSSKANTYSNSSTSSAYSENLISEESVKEESSTIDSSKEEVSMKSLILKIQDQQLEVFWLDNESVNDLKVLAKDTLTIEMHRFGDFEQVGDLPSSISSNDETLTANYGDIMLYRSNKIVIFYGSNTYSYTKLGHINLRQQELTELLSESDVNISLELK